MLQCHFIRNVVTKITVKTHSSNRLLMPQKNTKQPLSYLNGMTMRNLHALLREKGGIKGTEKHLGVQNLNPLKSLIAQYWYKDEPLNYHVLISFRVDVAEAFFGSLYDEQLVNTRQIDLNELPKLFIWEQITKHFSLKMTAIFLRTSTDSIRNYLKGYQDEDGEPLTYERLHHRTRKQAMKIFQLHDPNFQSPAQHYLQYTLQATPRIHQLDFQWLSKYQPLEKNGVHRTKTVKTTGRKSAFATLSLASIYELAKQNLTISEIIKKLKIENGLALKTGNQNIYPIIRHLAKYKTTNGRRLNIEILKQMTPEEIAQMENQYSTDTTNFSEYSIRYIHKLAREQHAYYIASRVAGYLGTTAFRLQQALSQIGYDGDPLLFSVFQSFSEDTAETLFGDRFDSPLAFIEIDLEYIPMELIHDQVSKSCNLDTAAQRLSVSALQFKKHLDACKVTYDELRKMSSLDAKQRFGHGRDDTTINLTNTSSSESVINTAPFAQRAPEERHQQYGAFFSSKSTQTDIHNTHQWNDFLMMTRLITPPGKELSSDYSDISDCEDDEQQDYKRCRCE